jgi:membrane protein YqaA with SNARE-associated domain
LASLVWGFAEASFFFIVPDVLLSWIALHQPRKAFGACVWATVGALAGGAVMYAWGATDQETALLALERVPAVNRKMCDTVEEQIRSQGIAAVFLGPITGTPYKVYAVQAGAKHVSLVLFLLVSLPARLVRFALVTAMTVVIVRSFPASSLFVRRTTHLVLWSIFYGWYFWIFGG